MIRLRAWRQGWQHGAHITLGHHFKSCFQLDAVGQFLVVFLLVVGLFSERLEKIRTQRQPFARLGAGVIVKIHLAAAGLFLPHSCGQVFNCLFHIYLISFCFAALPCAAWHGGRLRPALKHGAHHNRATGWIGDKRDAHLPQHGTLLAVAFVISKADNFFFAQKHFAHLIFPPAATVPKGAAAESWFSGSLKSATITAGCTAHHARLRGGRAGC